MHPIVGVLCVFVIPRLVKAIIRESVDCLRIGMALIKRTLYNRLHHKYAESLFKPIVFLFECLCDQQDSYKCPNLSLIN